MTGGRGDGPPPHGVIEVDQADAPPPIPPAELPREELARLVDEGNVLAVEGALRAQNVRVPSVLDELQRVLGLGHGNLAAALVTMLVQSFHISRADRLAEQVLVHADTAGSEELVDLAAALYGQERLGITRRVLDVVLAREADHGRALYLVARTLARRGRAAEAFETISRVSPKVLGAAGLAVQARYALLAGRLTAYEGALRHAKKVDDVDVGLQLNEIERIRGRLERAPELAAAMTRDLRAAMAIEYGSLLLELARDAGDGGRFGMDPVTARDAGRLVLGAIEAIRALGLPLRECLFANEDGEIVAAAIARKAGVAVKEWRAQRVIGDGTWLCMASAATHPHVPNVQVQEIQDALDRGTLRTFALILPSGWRGPLVPDLVGRVTGDDELPWAIDDEVEETVDRIFGEGAADEEPPTEGLVSGDGAALLAHLERARRVLRSTQPEPRAPHVPFFDETPVPRG